MRKEIILAIIADFIAIIIGCTVVGFIFASVEKPVEKEVIIQVDTVYVESDWSKMVSALIKVESNGKADAVNASTGATGILQIMPIYVAEANRISGRNFSLEDRYSPEMSIDMFNIVQAHHNPKRDIEKAIRMHNPRGGDWYYRRVIKAMEEI